MPLLSKTRPYGDLAPEATDELLQVSVKPGDAGVWEIWCEWRVQLPSGRYDHRSEKADAELGSSVIDSAFMADLQQVADNTYLKVKP